MKLNNKEIWPCGCITGTDVDDDDVFVIQPCSKNCFVYKTAINLSNERKNTVEYRRDSII